MRIEDKGRFIMGVIVLFGGGNVEVGLAFAIWQLDAYSVTPKSYSGFITTRNNVDDRYIFVSELDNEEALKKPLRYSATKRLLESMVII